MESGTNGPDEADRLAPGDSVGRYVVIRTIGAGAMGMVYLAYDPELDRRVALKLLHADAGRDQHWLLREAQAMAQLRHPNVVAVHDVGTFEDRVFMAMEFVEGTTVSQWLKTRRTWHEIQPVFVQAARGLAAAHGAGLVHGDVKPDNLLIADRGRVYVGDFGLARASLERSSGAHPAVPTDVMALGDSQRLLSNSQRLLTTAPNTRGRRGTRVYLAPEQRAGGVANARSDQYALCASLHAALTGEPPPRGGGVAAPHSVTIPAWLRKTLERGLQSQPGNRYADMNALLADLSRDPRRTRRRLIVSAVAATIVASVAIGTWQLQRTQGQLCKAADRKLEEIWTPTVRDRVRTAFVDTDMPFAIATFTEVERLLGGYAHAWVEQHVDACEAAQIRGEQPAEVLDLRMRCLDRRLSELGALTRVLGEADTTVVREAVQAASTLRPVEHCADVASLTAEVAPPPEHARTAVEAVRAQLAEASALRSAGKYAEGLAVALGAVTASGAVDYAPIRAEALLLAGTLHGQAGDAELSASTVRDALWAAWDGAHDEVAADALTSLVFTLSENLGEYQRAERHARHAEAVLERIGGDRRREASLLRAIGVLHFRQGNYEESRAHHARALGLMIEELGEDHVLVASTHNTLGNALNRLGRHDEALEHYGRALAIWAGALGTEHPLVASLRNNLGALHYRRGEFDAALMELRRAYEIRLAVLGPDHREIAASLGNLGAVSYELGRYDEAIEWHTRARALAERLNGPDSPSVAGVLVNLGVVYQAQERLAEAHEVYVSARDTFARARGEDHPFTALATHNIGRVLHDQGKLREALQQHLSALRIREATKGGDPSEVAASLVQIGRVRVDLGTPADAIIPLERALALLATAGESAPALADARFALARALWDTNTDRERAIELAHQAVDGLRQTPRSADRLGTIAAWLEQRP